MRPYRAAGALQALFLIHNRPPPTFKQPEAYSRTFVDFVSACLKKEPTERPTATELMEARADSSLALDGSCA